MLRATRIILSILKWLNWLVGVPILLLLILTFPFEPQLVAGLSRDMVISDMPATLTLLRLTLLLVAPIMVAAHILFVRLIAVIDSVGAGRSFAADNARRLRHMAWALLVCQVADLGYGALSVRLTATTDEYFGWSFGLTGWMAVLLLFILAKVFEEGRAMRDELDEVV